ncbi:MAG: hypothetical protein WKF47_02755 [Geodermatophilaceae bacterium]
MSTPEPTWNLQRGTQVVLPVADHEDVRHVDTLSVRSSSASHGPLRSATRPVRTSVPVTMMPARALTGAA